MALTQQQQADIVLAVNREVLKQAGKTSEQTIAAREAAKTREAAAAKAEQDNAIAVFESLGIPRAGAIEAAKGREQRGW